MGKLPRGIETNGNQLRISFMLNGVRCREPLRDVGKIDKAAIAYASHKRSAILVEIREGRFSYAKHFPDSPRAALFSGEGGPALHRTVEEGVELWMKVQRAKKAPSTSRNYGHKARHVIEKFGKRKIANISKSEIELFQAELLRKGLSPKTVNDIFTVIRGIWSDAFSEGALKSNPLDRIKNLDRDLEDDSADPFTRDELARIRAVKTKRTQDITMILFACWTGLSLSELIGLGWDDVDFSAGTVRVRRARVESIYKVPKEKVRIRTIELVAPALSLLRDQFASTGDLPPVTVEVFQRDNITSRNEAVRFIFRNGMSGEPWHPASLGRWFAGHLKRAGVRHRGPNQCRHTFASQMLSSYVPVEWVARQLGHTDTSMVRKHYGRWIPGDTRSMASLVSQMLGFDSEGTERGPPQ